MEPNYKVLDDAISRGDVEVLFTLYKQSLTHGGGQKTRDYIEEHTTELLENTKLPFLKERPSFRQVVELWDTERLRKLLLQGSLAVPKNKYNARLLTDLYKHEEDEALLGSILQILIAFQMEHAHYSDLDLGRVLNEFYVKNP